MTQLLFFFWSSFLVALTGAMMPGPVLTATIGESTRRGFLAGPLITLGHGLLEIALLAAILAGLGAWLALPGVQATLGLVGGVVLVIMGLLTAWTSRGAARQAACPAAAGRAPAYGTALTGLLTTGSNPYWYLWWATVGLAYASYSLRAGLTGLAFFFAGHILADLVWYSFVSAGVAGGRRWLGERGYRAVLVTCGLVLVGLGVWFAYTGQTLLRGGS